MAIIDTHTHLYDIADAPKALLDAGAAQVSHVVALGVDLASNERHLELARGGSASLSPRVHLAFGLHPGNITTPSETDACFAFMRTHLNEAVAIGETGLDYHYKPVKEDPSKQALQREVFERHLDLAKETGLPVVIHSRAAWRDCLDMTLSAGIVKANFHWYSGPDDILREILDAGFFISVSPSLEYSPESRRAAEIAPLEQILVETDTPVRGWMPQDVWRTLRALAAIKKMEEPSVLRAVNDSAERFFNLQLC